MNRIWLALLLLLLAACGTQAPRPVIDRAETSAGAVPPAPTFKPEARKPAPAIKYSGGFYQDDGPGDNVPQDIDAIPDAVPRAEPLHRFANNPYSVLGHDYVPLRERAPYKARGIGSWYGRKFHGQKTSSGERYDMFGMTAAHPTLPIPSYVRVSNPANGRAVVVRVNDRGPFHAGRLIDLSWTAAYKLGYIGSGSTVVDVESVQPGQTLAAAAPPSGNPGTQNTPPAPPAEEDPIARLAAAEPEPPLPQVQNARGHFVQLGAFGNRDNAEALRARLTRELGELAGKLVVQSAGKLFRVQLGPWPDAAAAQLAGARLRESFGMTPVIVQR
ncbi:MAG: septal ring lytic transglycosylase RlpA family protein [Sulfuritalea sp.]|nr:septal ring lytic transglycosylase RlpA family protein [Sulfuritalea sp.]MDP1981827.1 septal ring lytic transglycosylase RlpA family protein [Sulfuritalea sp.]